MDLLRIVLILQSGRNIGFRTLDPIDKVRTPLNHSLIDQFFEGLLFAHIAQIVEEHIPEARIHQVSGRMLDSSDIEVDIAPILIRLFRHELLVVVRIHIAQIVGRRTGKSGHGA